MKIYLHEIGDLETELDFDQTAPWLVDAVERADERQEGAPEPASRASKRAKRMIQAHFSLRKVDEVVVASGNVKTHIELICSRCANPFQLEVQPSFSSLFCQDPVMAGVAHLEHVGEDGRGPTRPVGQTKGFARHAHDYASDHLVASGKDLDITYLSQNFIDLSDLLSEQLLLQIPFQPLCRADCKGICATCGSDLNIGRCACAKISKTSPFAVLQGFKV